jgi:hypothetical protein
VSNSISVNKAVITERQRLSARQLASLNKNTNLASGDGSLDAAENTPAYILDLSDPAINRAANHLQLSDTIQDQKTGLSNSPAYIVDISGESIRMAQEQKAGQNSSLVNA